MKLLARSQRSLPFPKLEPRDRFSASNLSSRWLLKKNKKSWMSSHSRSSFQWLSLGFLSCVLPRNPPEKKNPLLSATPCCLFKVTLTTLENDSHLRRSNTTPLHDRFHCLGYRGNAGWRYHRPSNGQLADEWPFLRNHHFWCIFRDRPSKMLSGSIVQDFEFDHPRFWIE